MDELMSPLLKLLLPRLGSRDDDTRLGAVETVVQVRFVLYTHKVMIFNESFAFSM